jgi:mono/diheme cytochrome c family protein
MKRFSMVIAALLCLPLLWAFEPNDSESVTSADNGVSLIELQATTAGKAAFKKAECASCHSVKALGIKKTGDDDPDAEIKPLDLSGFGNKGVAPATLGKYLRKKTKLNGRKHKKKYKGDPVELETIVNFVLSLK